MTLHAPNRPLAPLPTLTTLTTASTSTARLNSPELRYLALAGPTAAGKTAAALAIASRHAVEIISVDSALVYRGMDIGSAKPSAAERAAVPHHLIDIRDPLHAYSAAEFVRDASRLIADIHARGKWPLLVGGTMLYFKALRDGLDDMPAANATVRAQIAHEAAAKGWPALHAELTRVDPITAARLAPADAQRIARALEVYRATGQPLSAFHTTNKIATSTYELRAKGQIGAENRASDKAQAKALTNPPSTLKTAETPQSLLISLEPLDRAWLHQRIAQRFDAMLAAGFLDEVKALKARGDLQPDLPAMRCVGYRQAWDYLDALQAQADANDIAISTPALAKMSRLADLRDQSIAATRQLAKRQLTWLRSMPQRCIVPCDAPDALARVLALADGFCNQANATPEPTACSL